MRIPAICALVFVATSVSAGEVRYPITGSPAVMAKIPDGWSAKDADGKLVARSSDGSSWVTISIAPYQGTLDALAEETFMTEKIDPPRLSERHAVSVVDLDGYWWPSFQIGADGKTRRVFFCDVMVGGGKALTGTLISPDDEGDDYHAGIVLLGSLKLAHD
jgi:hypothetical protein